MKCVPPRLRPHLRIRSLRCPPRGTNSRLGAALRRSWPARDTGFTLIELTIALVLLALISSLMFGSLSMAARSWDGGEAKAEQVSSMRQTQTFLREQIGAELPIRLKKVAELPLMFAGERDELRYAAALPPRVQEGGTYFFRLAVAQNGEKSQLILERTIPDPAAIENPGFTDAEHSVLADDIAELRISYFGRDANAADADTPSWRDRWDDTQRLPLLVRIDVKPAKGLPWPTLVVEPRRAPESACASYDSARNRCVGAT
jgi:general secretion pathway protein J